jgi:type VI secretion system protein VasD
VIAINEQQRNVANLRLDERGIRNLDDPQERSR